MASVQIREMLAAAAAACEDKKAEDIRILALDPSESGLTDYFLICTGTNDRQTVAITDEIELRLKREFATYPNSVEGRRQGEWILMDYVDFIVHVFLPEKRAYYGLERLRPSANTLSINDLNADIKAAIAANRPAKKAAGSTQIESSRSPAKSTRKAAGKTAGAKETSAKSTGAKQSPANAKQSPAKKTSAKSIAKRAEVAAKSPAKKMAKAASKRPAKAATTNPAKKAASGRR